MSEALVAIARMIIRLPLPGQCSYSLKTNVRLEHLQLVCARFDTYLANDNAAQNKSFENVKFKN